MGLRVVALILAWAMFACSDDDSGLAPMDAGVDADATSGSSDGDVLDDAQAIDAREMRPDAGPTEDAAMVDDAEVDAPLDVGNMDASLDAPLDSGFEDVGIDALMEGGSADAATDVGADVIVGCPMTNPALCEEVPEGQVDFSFTGDAVQFVVPDGICTLNVTLTGGGGGGGAGGGWSIGQGGAMRVNGADGSMGSPGAMVNASFEVVPGEMLSVIVGGGGGGGTPGRNALMSGIRFFGGPGGQGGPGGYGDGPGTVGNTGGGTATADNTAAVGGAGGSGGGGGASSIRRTCDGSLLASADGGSGGASGAAGGPVESTDGMTILNTIGPAGGTAGTGGAGVGGMVTAESDAAPGMGSTGGNFGETTGTNGNAGAHGAISISW